MTIQHLDQVTDEHSATWYLIYRNTGEQRIRHLKFTDYEDARQALLERVACGYSNVNEIIVRPYRLAQHIQVA